MSEIPKETAVVKKLPLGMEMGDRGLQLRSFEDAYRFAKVVVESNLAPKGLDTPEKVLLAIQMGAELGFSPMRSLSVVVVVNGRPSLMGEGALAKIHEANVCTEPPVVRIAGDGDERKAIVRFQRKDMPQAAECSFSVADAKKAGLWGKTSRSGEPSPWVLYPDDMLQWRAIARMVKRYFGDVTLGLPIFEEARDYPQAEPQKREAPPEPDPLLAEAPATEQEVIDAEVFEPAPVAQDAPIPQESEPEPQPTRARVATEPPPDEAAIIKAVEKLEGKMLSAETAAQLRKVWKDAESLVAKLSSKEQTRLGKQFAQLLMGLDTEK